jgi:sugar phosphate isomerase/epimerase
MPRFAASNIALGPYDHGDQLEHLPSLGLEGLEVAPSRVWRDSWKGLAAAQVKAYRKQAEDAGLRVIGLHSLFFDQPGLGLFKGREVRAETLDFLVYLSSLCRDLGGKTMIYGGGRRRGNVGFDDAFAEAVEFCGEFCRRVEGHGTVLCFEPLGPADSDFINTVADALAIVEAVDHPALAMQIDAKALVDNEEAGFAPFRMSKETLVHFHANEPGLAVLGSSGTVDHAAFGGYLKKIGYQGFVSIEQRMLNESDPLADMATSARLLKECYA